MSNHTPGPWTACNNDGYSIWRIFTSWRTGNKTIAEVVGDSAETEANARLIVAAPEMYELLREVSQAYDYEKSTGELAGTLYDLRCMAIRLLNQIEGGGA